MTRFQTVGRWTPSQLLWASNRSWRCACWAAVALLRSFSWKSKRPKKGRTCGGKPPTLANRWQNSNIIVLWSHRPHESWMRLAKIFESQHILSCLVEKMSFLLVAGVYNLSRKWWNTECILSSNNSTSKTLCFSFKICFYYRMVDWFIYPIKT